MASIWIVHQLIASYDTFFYKSYFYYIVTFFGFALYGIWGQILMWVLLSSFEGQQELIATAASFLSILGMPFLIISWIMLVKMSYALVGITPKRTTVYFQILFFIVVIPLVCGLYIFFKNNSLFSKELLVDSNFVFIFLIEMISMAVFTGTIFYYFKKYKKAIRKIISRFAVLMLLGLFLRGSALYFYDYNTWILPPLVLLYFLSNLMPLLYLKLKSEMIFKPIFAERPNMKKKAWLFETYQITKREKEIINVIIQGKTNQQIADELFISLQTVKDHTHRIYTKIGINSRLKLVQIING